MLDEPDHRAVAGVRAGDLGPPAGAVARRPGVPLPGQAGVVGCQQDAVVGVGALPLTEPAEYADRHAVRGRRAGHAMHHRVAREPHHGDVPPAVGGGEESRARVHRPDPWGDRLPGGR